MQQNFEFLDQLDFRVGSKQTLLAMEKVPPMQPFSPRVIAFLNELSKELMRSGKAYSDVFTFGFWIRKASMSSYIQKYDDLDSRFGRGIAFHSTPSNVPVNFGFSLVMGLLSGNANILRLPAKDFPQVVLICKAINTILEKDFSDLAPYIVMVKYASQKELHDYFSQVCDTRIIWGGDETIQRMRHSQLKPRAIEMTFSDRYSIAVIDADQFLQAQDQKKIIIDFYNDTYFNDQNACTSPQLIVWTGQAIAQAKTEFWDLMHEVATQKYALSAHQAIGKLDASLMVASQLSVHIEASKDAYITRIRLDNIEEDIMLYKYNSGFFFEYEAKDLVEILPILGARCQTLSYFGFTPDAWIEFTQQNHVKGIDRIVPIGKSMDFSLIWDGFDVIRVLSRKIEIL